MHTTPRALAPLTFSTALAYEAVVRFRNALYERAILRRRRLQSPVISIGNISTGGTGKTPLAIYTARKIAELGLIPVVLSRGYGRPDPGTSKIVPPGKQIQSPAREMGDEPALIRRHVPETWFGISKDRFSIGNRIERDSTNVVFVLDDGFQHRKLHRDLDIVVIDATQPLGSNRIFPRGTLREPLSGLIRCHAVVINGTADPETTRGPVPSEIRALGSQADIFSCEQSIERLIPYASWKNAGSPKPHNTVVESVFLVAALGNPARFQSDVLKAGIRVAGTRFFKDHHRLRPHDWKSCAKTALEAGADAILISEKDAVKISEPPDFPLLVSMQTTRFFDEESFEKLLRRCIQERRNV